MYDRTRKDLLAMIVLLNDDESHGWAKFFEKALRAFDDNNFIECARIIQSGSGGMGSLNDLVLGQGKDENGNFKRKTGHDDINKKVYDYT